mmetsp:Transcript_52708/g.163549  ORF Transcript_52708/g.163549 Transcript_52708/m.163549 type:complete len:226 (+) Transcript_52708:3-680(+)
MLRDCRRQTTSKLCARPISLAGRSLLLQPAQELLRRLSAELVEEELRVDDDKAGAALADLFKLPDNLGGREAADRNPLPAPPQPNGVVHDPDELLRLSLLPLEPELLHRLFQHRPHRLILLPDPPRPVVELGTSGDRQRHIHQHPLQPFLPPRTDRHRHLLHHPCDALGCPDLLPLLARHPHRSDRSGMPGRKRTERAGGERRGRAGGAGEAGGAGRERREVGAE